MSIATSPLTRRFGVAVTSECNQIRLDELPMPQLAELYVKCGAVLLRGFRVDMDSFEELTSKFILDSVNNGQKSRHDVVASTHIQTVNTGISGIPLHAEMAYSPMRPDILFFYCLKSPQRQGGETLLCDGNYVWMQMEAGTKNVFEQKKIRYKFDKSEALGHQCRSHKSMLADDRRVVTHRWHPTGELDIEFVVPAVQKARHVDTDVFANSVIVEDESAHFDDGSPISHEMRTELFVLTTRLSHRLKWQDDDILVIDNSRIMHGRTKITAGDPRCIVLRMGFEKHNLLPGNLRA